MIQPYNVTTTPATELPQQVQLTWELETESDLIEIWIEKNSKPPVVLPAESREWTDTEVGNHEGQESNPLSVMAQTKQTPPQE